jgi:hypothetical protein
MVWTYNADCYCDACGEAIRHALDGQGKTPDNPSDEYTYDSDDYPKYCSNDEETDCPQHCGSGEECLNAEVLPSGRKIGCLIGTSLTSAGVEYVKEAIAKGGEVAELWAAQFSDYL